MNQRAREELKQEIEILVDKISEKYNFQKVKLSEAPEEVQEFVNEIINMILARDRKIVEPLIQILDMENKRIPVSEQKVWDACIKTLKNAGVDL